MGKPVLFLLFVIALVFGQKIFMKFMVKASGRFLSENTEENGNTAASEWENDGKRRSFENAEYVPEKEDFFENEKTETASLEEELKGLSDEEIENIAKEAGILGVAGGKDE